MRRLQVRQEEETFTLASCNAVYRELYQQRKTGKNEKKEGATADLNDAVDEMLEDVPIYKPRNTSRFKTKENSYVVSMGCVGLIGDWILAGTDQCYADLSPEQCASKITRIFEQTHDLHPVEVFKSEKETSHQAENLYVLRSESGSLMENVMQQPTSKKS